MSRKWTDEQQAIFDYQGDLGVEAAAGAGKSSTLAEMARRRPKENALYLVYNRANRIEGQALFARMGLSHVQVDTAHSLAWRTIMAGGKYKLADDPNLKAGDIAESYAKQIDVSASSRHISYLIAAQTIKYLTAFFNSSDETVDDVEYEDLLSSPDSLSFFKSHRERILRVADAIWQDMINGTRGLTHDAYLKMFQLSKPVMPQQCFLLDEGQDSSDVILDIFMRQKGRHVVVGDPHQQLYGFRNATDALGKTGYPSLPLSNSFRFGTEIAAEARASLELKKMLGCRFTANIKGLGPARHEIEQRKAEEVMAILTRSNAALLAQAIEAVCSEHQKVWFEGGAAGYQFLNGGGGLFDVLSIVLKQPEKVRSATLKPFTDLDSLIEFQKASDDRELSQMIEISRTYGGSLYGILKEIKANIHPSRDAAKLILSTVHKSKGAEYAYVTLPDAGFITGSKIGSLLAMEEKERTGQLYGPVLKKKKDPKPSDRATIIEEVNVLYVAITRAIKGLDLQFDYSAYPAGK